MAKSRGRKFAEITSPASGVFDLTSVPTITNAKLQNSAMTLAGSSVSLGGTGVANTDALSEGSSNVYFTDARVQTFLGGGTLAGNVVVPDNRSIYIGSNSDFRIIHNTINTQLTNTTGALQITSSGALALSGSAVAVTGAATFSSTITATGTITGTLATAAQPNITSVGTLTGLAVTGNATISTSGGTELTLSGNFPRLYFVDTAGSDLDAYIVNNANGLFFGKTNSPTVTNDVMMLDLTNQRVGIGVSTPGAPLEIKNTADPLLILQHTEASDNAAMHFKHGGTTNGHIYVNNDRTMYFSTVATNPAMVIKVGGDVGIGTGATANYRLDLSDTIADQNPILYAAASGTPADAFNWIAEFMAPNIAQDKRVTLALGKARSSNNAVTMSYVQRAVTNNNALTFGHFGNNDLVSFCYSGNVGIGLTDPAALLNVDVGAPSSTDQTLGLFQSQTSRRIGFVWDDSASTLGVATLTSHPLVFHAGGNSSEKMRIDTSGNVGIGQNNPSGKLHITDGNNHAKFGDFHSNSTMTLQMSDTSTHPVEIQAYGSELRFNTTPSSGATAVPRMHIQNDGHIRVNPGAADYDGHTNVDQHLFTVQTSYNANGDQNLNIVNHDGNWQDGTSGADSAFGLMWGYQNNIRAGIHYDHRGIEKFDFYSGYGAMRFRIRTSAAGNQSPIGSETVMPPALTIIPGGNVGIGTARGGITPSASLHVAGENNGYDGTIRIGERGYFAHRDSGQTKTWVANNYNSNTASFGIRMKGIADSNEVVTVLGNGKVGLGTDPDDKFHSYNTTAENWRFENGEDGSTGKIYLKTTDNTDMSKYLMMSGYWTEIGVHNNEGLRVRGSDGNIKLTLTGAAGNLSVAGSVSDRNFKKDIEDIDTATDIIKAAKPKTFEFIKHVKRKAAGFIAQDMQEILPDLVSGEEYDEEIESSGLGFDYIGYTAYLTKALQESIARIEALEAEVTALKG